jgi:hypothetical protein
MTQEQSTAIEKISGWVGGRRLASVEDKSDLISEDLSQQEISVL